MIEEYAVKAESPEGIVVMLRRGFASKNEAEDYRVTMSQWKRASALPGEPYRKACGGH